MAPLARCFEFLSFCGVGDVLRIVGIAALALISGATDVNAKDFGLSEIRGGAMVHGVELSGHPNFFDSIDLSRFDDVNFEALFRSPEIGAFQWLGAPRPAVGFTISTKGYESFVHGGLDWHWQFGQTPFFAELGLGLSVHDGYLHDAPTGYRDLGCRVLAYERADLGVNLSEHWSAMLTMEHSSHAALCGADNQGINELGVRVGYKF